jgi:hypothetical protein
VEIYKSETREVVRRFIARRISYQECIAGLDAALAALIPELPSDQMDALRTIMLANNDMVMKEMERRAVASRKAESFAGAMSAKARN